MADETGPTGPPAAFTPFAATNLLALLLVTLAVVGSIVLFAIGNDHGAELLLVFAGAHATGLGLGVAGSHDAER